MRPDIKKSYFPIDYHMHTNFSADGYNEPEEMILASINKGLRSICFTDHQDKELFEDGRELIFEPNAYFNALIPLKEKYADQIQVRIGVEIGMQPHLNSYFEKLTNDYPFDFVIGSSHTINGIDPYYRTIFEGQKDGTVYGWYFKELLEDVLVTADFDVLGHLDYIVRYGFQREKEYSYKLFSDEIDAILKAVIEKGKGIEINTAGLKYGLPFAHPHLEVIKRYRQLGGEIITVGADAHKTEHVAYDFHVVKDLLREAGFAYYTEFVERKPYFCAVE